MSTPEVATPASPPPRSRLRRLLFNVLALIGAGTVLVVVVLAGYSLLGIGDEKSTTTDPAEIDQIGAQIAKFEAPDGFTAKKGMDSTPFSMKYAIYNGPEAPSMLMLVSIHVEAEEPAKVKAKLDELLPHLGEQHTGFRVEMTTHEERDVVVAGQPARLSFGEGKEVSTQRECRQVIGTFEGEQGTTGLVLIADKESMTEDQITALIDSLK